MNPRRFAGGCHTPPESACEAVSASAHVVAVHAGVSHPANSGRHASAPAPASTVICANAAAPRAELRAARLGTRACMSAREGASEGSPELSPTP